MSKTLRESEFIKIGGKLFAALNRTKPRKLDRVPMEVFRRQQFIAVGNLVNCMVARSKTFRVILADQVKSWDGVDAFKLYENIESAMKTAADKIWQEAQAAPHERGPSANLLGGR